MKKLMVLCLCCLVFSAIGVNAKSSLDKYLSGLEPGRDYAPGEILIKFKPQIQQQGMDGLLQEYKLGLISEKPILGWYKVSVLQDRELAVPYIISKLKEDDRIYGATPNLVRHMEWEPNDWFYTSNHLWNLRVTNMPQAWDMDTDPPIHGGDPDVVVAIIDTGAAYKNYVDTENYTDDNGNPLAVTFARAPDFENLRVWENVDEIPDNGIDDDHNGYIDDAEGWNFAYGTRFPCDDKGHGTHVTGTVAQSTDNDDNSPVMTLKSAVGLAFECTVMPLKTSDRTGSSYMDAVANAILYAADNGAHVINMSLGAGYVGDKPGPNVESDACSYAYEHGLVVVSSAGNDADEWEWDPMTKGIGLPAGYSEVISVGASCNATQTGDPSTESSASFSQYGFTSEVMAPSGDGDSGDSDNSGRNDTIFQQVIIIPSWPVLEDFTIKGNVGTSMASPHVAAEAALILSYGKQMGWNFTNEDVRCIIDASCYDINNNDYPGYDYNQGFGRIDVQKALMIAHDVKPVLYARTAELFEGPGQGNGNYRPEAGETVSIKVSLMSCFADSTGIHAVLTSSSPYVTIQDGEMDFNNTNRNTITEPLGAFRIKISDNCPLQEDAEFQLTMSCNEAITDTTNVFNLRLTPANLLFWDDDRAKGRFDDLDLKITSVLDNNAIPYEYFNTLVWENPQKESLYIFPWEKDVTLEKRLTFDDLKVYDNVIWFLSEKGNQGLTKDPFFKEMLPDVVEYLEDGGNMLITSHELLYKILKPGDDDDLVWVDETANEDAETNLEYGNWFTYNILRIKGIEHDDYYTSIVGGNADPLTRSMQFDLDSSLYNNAFTHDYAWWPDNIVPREDVTVVFTSGDPTMPADDFAIGDQNYQETFEDDKPFKAANNPCGIRYETDKYRLIFLAFGLETAVNGADATLNLVNWLIDGTEPDPGTVLVDIDTNLNSHTYNADYEVPMGDPFSLYGMVYNPGSSLEAQRWVLLEIQGAFFFWPTWSADPVFATRTLPSGFSSENFLNFPEWPEGLGEWTGINWWFAHLNMANTELLGEYDICTWSYY